LLPFTIRPWGSRIFSLRVKRPERQGQGLECRSPNSMHLYVFVALYQNTGADLPFIFICCHFMIIILCNSTTFNPLVETVLFNVGQNHCYFITYSSTPDISSAWYGTVKYETNEPNKDG
jgi:hypothetical protein